MLNFQAEITGMLIFDRNYWSSCRVCLAWEPAFIEMAHGVAQYC